MVVQTSDTQVVKILQKHKTVVGTPVSALNEPVVPCLSEEVIPRHCHDSVWLSSLPALHKLELRPSSAAAARSHTSNGAHLD